MRITVRARLVAMVGVGALAVGVMGTVAALSTRTQSRHTAELAKVSGAMSAQWNADMMHDGLRADVMSAVYARTDAQRAAYGVDEVSEHSANMLQNFDLAGAAAPAELQAEFVEVRPAVVKYTELAQRLVTTAAAAPATAAGSLPEFLAAFSDLEDRLGQLDSRLSEAVDAREREAEESGSSNLRWIIVCGVLAAAALVAFSLWVIRAIRRPLTAMVTGLRRMAAKDMTVHVPAARDDELGEMANALNAASASVRDLLVTMTTSTRTLTAAGTELEDVSVRLGHAVEETMAKSTDVARSAGQVTSAVVSISAASDQINASVGGVAEASATAVSVATAAVRTTEETSAGMDQLRQASQEVDEIVRAITAIAGQTNLLALNATIEAARAGEAGRGFAVVADEVKDLAQETANATENVKIKISTIQEMTGRAVEAIAEISSVIGQINNDQNRIAAAVSEQTRTTAGIVSSVGAVRDTATQINDSLAAIGASASSTAESATATRQSATTLIETAREMDLLIGQFSY